MKLCAVVVSALLLALGTGGWGSRPEPSRIFTIQGASHLSPLLGRRVTTEGVVTAIAERGLYLQDPAGDGDGATSDAIFVETQPRGAVGVGDRIRVVGTVAESASELRGDAAFEIQIFNFLRMLDRDWGQVKTVGGLEFFDQQVLDVVDATDEADPAERKHVVTFNPELLTERFQPVTSNASINRSTYYVQAGLKYSF
jgi:hypothetical protein